jgi:acyl carrier protein
MQSMTRENAAQILRDIWNELLGFDDFSDSESFFELGGDSLLALEVSALARGRGLQMPLAAVLRLPTIDGLVEAVLDPRLFGAPIASE